jgi:phosphogluconate dehydratase
MTNSTLLEITERITERSKKTRKTYLDRMEQMRADGPLRGTLSCSNLAHGFAASEKDDKQTLRLTEAANIGIVNAYNDML